MVNRFVLMMMFSFYLLAGEEHSEIRILKEATVADNTITLNDVATFTGIDGDEYKSLKDFSLGAAPAPGQKVVWTSAEVSQKLRKLASKEFGFQISIPDDVTVYRGQKTVGAKDVEEALKPIYKQSFPDTRVLVTVRTLPEKVMLQSNDTWKVDLIEKPVGNVSVPVVITQNEGRERRFWASANVRLLKKVAVAKRTIEARSLLSASDFSWEEKDVTYLSGSPVQTADLIDSMSRSTILPDTIITRNHLERQTAVKAGDEIKVVAGDESFLIETRGVAAQNGYIGDVIRIRNTYNKQLSGQVVAKGQVRVDYQ